MDDFKVGGPKFALASSFVLHYWFANMCYTVTLLWPACCLPDVEKSIEIYKALALGLRVQHSHTLKSIANSQ